MKFKVGDKVKFTYESWIGQGTIRIVDNSFLPYLVVSENGSHWWLKENELELINPDLRDLLQVGYRMKLNDGDISDPLSKENVIALKELLNPDLTISYNTVHVHKIYRPKYNGLKPMEWELIWQREKEKLYTLELPNNDHKHKYYRYHFKGNYNFNKGLVNDANVKCMFTQQEIDNLPNQELIKALVKKEVKGK